MPEILWLKMASVNSVTVN